MSPTRVVVADTLRIVRSGVRVLLEREGDFEVLEAASLEELVAAVEQAAPDIALVGDNLAPGGWVEAMRSLDGCAGTSLVAWGFAPSADTVVATLRAGADGFLAKEISAEALVHALRATVRGEAPLARDLVSVLIGELHEAAERTDALERTAMLSSREREVLDLVARGARNREIAVELAISEFTVKRHVQNILEKLELRSRREAAGVYRTALGAEEVPAGAG